MADLRKWFSPVCLRSGLTKTNKYLAVCLYCIIIIAFAFAYTLIPNDFSHVNLIKETTYHNIHDNAQKYLSGMIKVMISTKISQFIKYPSGMEFPKDIAEHSESEKAMVRFAENVKVTDVSFIENILIEDHGYYALLKSTVDIDFQSPHMDGPGTFSGSFPFHVSIQYPMDMTRNDRDVFFKILIHHQHRRFLYSGNEPVTPMAHEILVMLLEHIGNTKPADDTSNVSLLLASHIPDETISKNINELVLLNRGKPVGTYFCLFKRMLYLSMITITTLGYGDIVPLTDLARLLVGLEATLGVIVLGLIIAVFSRPLER